MSEETCRLCMSTTSDNHLNIFSDIGMEMKLGEIIGEHFQCEVSELDTLPNSVCQLCWQTTEAFHELYERSKMVQKKFICSTIKVEADANELWQTHTETHFIEESHVELCAIKIEPKQDEESDTNDNRQMEYDGNLSDSDGNSEEENANEVTKDDPKYGSNEESSISRRKRRRTTPKRISMQFDKLFLEYKHLFDLTCDSCPTTFETLDEARKHYRVEHNIPKGYIKCCSNKLKYPSKVLEHLQRHIYPDKFKCTECSKVYFSKRELEKHMKKHTEVPTSPKKTAQCNICKKMFSTKTVMDRHMKRHSVQDDSEDEQYTKFIAENFDMKCDRCDTIFGAFYDARQHYKDAHNEDNGYIKCCSMKLNKMPLVKDHIKSHLDPESLKCDLCNKILRSRIALTQHKRQHKQTEEKPFTCDYCAKPFSTKTLILRHILSNHSTIEPKFECEICSKKFQLAPLLRQHIYIVHREKKPVVTCEICGKTFYTKFHLDKHKLQHMDKSVRLAQRQQCEHCNEWLMSKSGIYYHEQIHKNEPQKCPHCQLDHPNKMSLQAHIRQYHRELKYKCSYCDKAFPIASNLKKHEESHTRPNKYPCQFCTKVFTLHMSRRTHQSRDHPQELKQDREMKKLMRNADK